MIRFEQIKPTTESYWRSIILFGQNVASYKFALAKSLLEIAGMEKTFVRVEELAVPFSKHIAEHLKISDKQGTSSSSKFLDTVRKFNADEISEESLISETAKLGFVNVIDAFHFVNREPIPVRFYVDERTKNRGIRITDELLGLKESIQFENLPIETEARWRLVETAWAFGISANLLEVRHDENADLMFVETTAARRINITSSRDALNGYQKGKCFYCFADISVEPFSENLADVDHFFPHTMVRANFDVNLNGIWNLVLACKHCNRGSKGKWAKVPKLKYLERLNTRNNFLIESHHPLRETLIRHTGALPAERHQFLQQQYNFSKFTLIHEWEAQFENESAF